MSTRSVILSLADSPVAKALIQKQGTRAPFVRRFVAGDQLSEALQAVRELHDARLLSALDYLGEDLVAPNDIEDAVQQYSDAIKALSTFFPEAYVSVKLTAIGLLSGKALAVANLRKLLSFAQERGNLFVRVDMEGSAHTQTTLDIVTELRPEFPNLGTVLQSYLRRTDEDMRLLNQLGIPMRLVKGAYSEPPSIAYATKAEVDRKYREQANYLVESSVKHSIATHDPAMIDSVKRHARANNITPDKFEFEMLLGIRRDLQQQLRQEGYTVRVYIPYGDKWYAYFSRRLAERPANIGFIMRNLTRK